MRNRLRILWAALTQRWYEQRCSGCGASWWSSQLHPEVGADLCCECEAVAFDQWAKSFEARNAQTKGAA